MSAQAAESAADCLPKYASHAVELGFSVLPPRQDGSKAPDAPTWTKYQTTLAATQQVKDWYRGGRTGFGVVTGAISGNLELFDFDNMATYRAFMVAVEAAGLSDIVARVRAGYEESTPNGVHWLTRCSEVGPSNKLACRPKPQAEQHDDHDKIQTLIETKGNGGYAILHPSNGSVHPSGGAYVLLSGGLETVAVITPEERADLWALARTFDELPVREVREPRQPSAPGAATGDRPGDDYNSRADWREILEPAGWAWVYRRPDGVNAWRRPGKSVGISATTGYAGADLFYPFTSSTEFEERRGYSKFSTYALLAHGGDFAAAARELGQQGYGAPPERRQAAPLPAAIAAAGESGDCAAIVAALTADYESRLAAMQEQLDRVRAQRDLAEAKAHKLSTLAGDLERIIANSLINQKVKLLYAALLIALHRNPRFAGADRQHVNICEDQISELLGGVDRGTVAAGLLILEAENLGDVVRTPTTKTFADGRTRSYNKLSLRIGPRAGEEALDLHTWAKLMRNPQDAEKGALRRERKQREPRVCPIDPTDTLQVVVSCVKHPDVIIGWDYVLPDVLEQLPAKVSPPPYVGTRGDLSAIDILGPRDRPGFGATSELLAKLSQLAVCTCGNVLAPGEACGRCNTSACGECGALVVGTLSRFCRGYCAGRAATVERYAGAPPEVAAAYAGGD